MRLCAILLLLSILFLPMYNGWPSNVLPNYNSVYFSDVLDSDLSGGPYQLTLLLLISAILLLIFALCKVKIMSIISSGIGLTIMVIELLIFLGIFTAEYVFSFTDSCLSIGFWITLLLYIICFYLSFDTAKSPKRNYSSSYSGKLSKIGQSPDASVPPNSWVCKVCGEKNTNLSSGCKKCGNRR